MLPGGSRAAWDLGRFIEGILVGDKTSRLRVGQTLLRPAVRESMLVNADATLD